VPRQAQIGCKEHRAPHQRVWRDRLKRGRTSHPGDRRNAQRERFDLSTGADIKMTTAAANASEMKNNLIYEADGSFRIVWGSFYTSLSSFQSAQGKGQDVLLSDPKFVNGTANDFRLQATSLAIDHAFNPVPAYIRLFESRFPGTSIAVDLTGVQRPQGNAWDIGAHEHAASGPNTIAKPSPPKVNPPRAPLG
jgi:hypothetical protein